MAGCMKLQPIDPSRFRGFLQLFSALLLIVLTWLLPACGSGGGGGGAGAPPIEPPVNRGPALQLSGDPAALVLPILPNVSPTRTATEDIDEGLLLSRVSVVLNRTATVADFNAAAQKIGATGIAYSRTNSPFLTLIIPRQQNGAAVNRLAALLRGHPGILLSVASRQLEGKELPSGSRPTADAAHLDHLWPSGFPAAWNARALAQANCDSRKVTVIVPDLYLGEPFNAFRDQVPGASENFDGVPEQPRNPDTMNLHGYEVAAILAGKFDGAAPTGSNPFPECLKIVPVDVSGLDFFQAVEVIRTAIEREEGKVVVNASIGYPITVCGSHGTEPCPTGAIKNALPIELQEQIVFRVAAGVVWAEFAGQPGVADDTFLAVAAGNERNATAEGGALGQVYAGFRNARLASPFAAAAQLPSLPAMLADDTLWTTRDFGYPKLTLDSARIDQVLQEFEVAVIPPVPDRNLTLVGSVTQGTTARDLNRSLFSNDEADLYAVGQAVTGLVATSLDGTSFSTPQVAGLASYLWLLDNELRNRPVEETLGLIRGTSQNNEQTEDFGRIEGIIDAYAAVLALDTLHPTKPIRRALVDIDNNGIFNHLDLQAFRKAYQLDNPDQQNPPPIPAARDYSRFDLNGDGYTGGILTKRFDLNADRLENGAPLYTTVTETIGEVPMPLNEAALTDVQILCYYAFGADSGGPFYDAVGDTGDLRATLPAHCNTLQMNVNLPGSFASSAELTVTVQEPNDAGVLEPVSGLLIQLELVPPQGCTTATASPLSDTTDGSGRFSSTISFGSSCRDITVIVSARADERSPLLAQQTVRASRRGLEVRLNNRIATTKGEVTGPGSFSVREQKESAYPPRQGRDYTRPDVTLNGSGVAPPPSTSSYTFAADYEEGIPPEEIETDTIEGGRLRLTVSCSAAGSTGLTVSTTGFADPILDFPEGRSFNLSVTGTLSGTTNETDFEGFEARFQLRNLNDLSSPAVKLTSGDGNPSKTFTSNVPIDGPARYDLGMFATAVCSSGSPERAASAAVELNFRITSLP